MSKKEKYLATAQKLAEKGQLDKALVEFAKVVEEDPKDTRTWLKMAELHAKRGETAPASDIYLRTGELYTEQGFAQKAVAVYKNVIKLSPSLPAAHLKLGAVYRQLGLLTDAVQQLEQAAGIMQRMGQPLEGVQALQQAAEIQPENVVLRVKLAEAASQAGMSDEAIREFTRAADQLKAQGRIDEFLRVSERLLFHQPDNVAKSRELAEVYIGRGTPRLALPKLQACLKSDPNDPRTLSLLARALEQLGQAEKAVSVLKELMRVCQDLGRISERDAAVLRALSLAPHDNDLQAAAARFQLRGSGAVHLPRTPPPVAFGEPGAGLGRLGAGPHVAGAEAPASESGRVLATVGLDVSAGAHLSGPANAPTDAARLWAECDVFVKYGLLDRAALHLARLLDVDPQHREAQVRLVSVLEQMGRKTDAARRAEDFAVQLAQTAPADAKLWAEKATSLDPSSERARELVRALGVSSFPSSGPVAADEDPLAEVDTPPPQASFSASGGVSLGLGSGPTSAPFGGMVTNGSAGHGASPSGGLAKPRTTGPVFEIDFEDVVEEVADTPPPMADAAMDVGTPPPQSDEPWAGIPTPPPMQGSDMLAIPGALAPERTPPVVRGKKHRAPRPGDMRAPGWRAQVNPNEVVEIDYAEAEAEFDSVPSSGGFDAPVTTATTVNLSPVPDASDWDPSANEVTVNAPPPVELMRAMIGARAAATEAIEAVPSEQAPPVSQEVVDVVDDDLAAELEEIDFFLEQSLDDEALASLEELAGRYPSHPAVSAKLGEVRARVEAAAVGATPTPLHAGGSVGETFIERPDEEAEPTPPPIISSQRDTRSHTERAKSFMDKGDYDRAIEELKFLVKDRRRGVFALTMMGECYAAKGSLTEAVIRYKKALNQDDVTDPESLLLYFLLGEAFERLGDLDEALYFYETVTKRDPRFRGVDRKLAALKPPKASRA